TSLPGYSSGRASDWRLPPFPLTPSPANLGTSSRTPWASPSPSCAPLPSPSTQGNARRDGPSLLPRTFFGLHCPFSCRKHQIDLPFRLISPPKLLVPDEIKPLWYVKLMGAVGEGGSSVHNRCLPPLQTGQDAAQLATDLPPATAPLPL